MRIREYNAIPNMEKFGEFIKPIPVEGYRHPEKIWYTGLSPWERLNSHQTQASVRRNVFFKSFRMAEDHLDLALKTTYIHNKELFPDPIDIYFQKITIYNQQIVKPQPGSSVSVKSHEEYIKYLHDKYYEPKTFKEIKRFVLARRLYPTHPLIIGGIEERIHPMSVKLMNSSHHSPQTNAGYMRQDRDGMVFYY